LKWSAILLIASTVGLTACGGDEPDEREPPPLVRTVTVAVGANEASSVAYTGVVRARIEADLGFRVPGKVVARLVDAGARVRAGQPLMRLDAEDLDLARQAADERLRSAQAEAERAATDQRRYATLVASGAVSRTEADRALAAQRTTAADLRAAQSAARQAANARSYAVLVADGGGTVTEVLAQPGQVVAAGTPVLRLARDGPREALVTIPESETAGLPRTAVAQVYGASAAWPATLREVAGAADPLTRTFATRYVLESGGASAPLGATVTLRMAGTGPAAVSLPLAALHDGGDGSGVWVVGPNDVVTLRRVQVLSFGDESFRVAPGALRLDERVVALGAQLLREGQRVRIAGPSSVPVR
jgi:RND family efflux transporter MFP subunit